MEVSIPDVDVSDTEKQFLDELTAGEVFQDHGNSNDQFQCANCSHIDFQARKVTDFVFSDPNGDGDGGSGEEIRLTVLEAISEIFSIKLEPLLVSCYEDIKLCSSCGLNLSALYKCFKQFTQFSTVDSVITGLLKIDKSYRSGEVEGGNEKRKSLRKNPKQLVRFDNTDTSQTTRRIPKLSRGGQHFETKFLTPIPSSQSPSPGTSSGQQYAEVIMKDEEVESDDYNEIEEVDTIDVSGSETATGALDIGVTGQGHYLCLNCGKVFPTKAGIILHLRFKHHISKDDAQEQCKHPNIVEQMSKYRRVDRLEIKRKRKSVPREDRIPLPCPHCPKSSWNQRDLNNHISSVHLKIKPFSCPLCDKPFSRKQQVEAHLKVHSGEKTSLCFLCGKSYSSAGALKGHLDRHFPKSAPPPNPVKFKCNLCDVYCTDMRRLNEHKLRHQDERNFQCDHCEKAFKTRRDLVKHRNYHKLKLEKPEQCPACEKRYSTKEILKFHLHSTHHYSLEDARAAAGIGLAAVVVYDQEQNAQ